MTMATVPTGLVGKELTFAEGLLGFAGAQRFELRRLGEDLAPFLELRCHGDGPYFVVVPPGALWPDYTLELPDESAERLQITSADDAAVLVIVTLRPAPQGPSVNLLGPLVVNVSTGAGAQVVLSPDQGDPAQAVSAPTWRPGR